VGQTQHTGTQCLVLTYLFLSTYTHSLTHSLTTCLQPVLWPVLWPTLHPALQPALRALHPHGIDALRPHGMDRGGGGSAREGAARDLVRVKS
jgi:hypothetical protein